MSAMTGSRHTFASYFAFAVDTILKVLWREGFARGPQELVTLTWYRIRRLERRFNALVAQWRSGTLPAVGDRGTDPSERTPHPDPPPQGGRELAPAPRAAWVFPWGRSVWRGKRRRWRSFTRRRRRWDGSPPGCVPVRPQPQVVAKIEAESQ